MDARHACQSSRFNHQGELLAMKTWNIVSIISVLAILIMQSSFLDRLNDKIPHPIPNATNTVWITNHVEWNEPHLVDVPRYFWRTNEVTIIHEFTNTVTVTNWVQVERPTWPQPFYGYPIMTNYLWPISNYWNIVTNKVSVQVISKLWN